MKNVWNKEFANVCHWFADNKLSIHFNEGKTECIVFRRNENLLELIITYDNNRIKEQHMVQYHVCCLDTNLSRESRLLKSFRRSLKNNSSHIHKMSF